MDSAHFTIELPELFATPAPGTPDCLSGQGFRRLRWRDATALDRLLDTFAPDDARCAFLRLELPDDRATVHLRCPGTYRLTGAAAGGWLLLPDSDDRPAYWLPAQPMSRRLDRSGHILAMSPATVTGVEVSASTLVASLHGEAGRTLDLVAWQLPPDDGGWVSSLQNLTVLEGQSYFLWSSHTAYQRPADVYQHLVHGHVYENHAVWPKYWRVCSELDAYALYVTLTGLLRATGKRLYDLLRTQVVFSVIARQAPDGGWYHGEWTDDMESHYRLHSGAMHMLAAYFEETADPAAGNALAKAAAFAAERTDSLTTGKWYLHDSLEASADSIKRYPFRIVPSRVLGKSPSNLLVLNTHLDTNIAMQRYRQVTEDARHDVLIASARATTRAVIALRPAEWLYRPLFWAIGLTFLPTEQARKLPLPLRAVKRLAWKYLVPLLPRIKARYPRFVMPGGFIERDLAQSVFSVRYQPVNLMDLVRTRRLFDEPGLDALLRSSFEFTRSSGLTRRWKEAKGREDDSLGFWAEALYHLCLASPEADYRAWLAEAMLDLEDNRLGLPPSLLGANAEAVAPEEQRPCPSPANANLRLANLTRGDKSEWLIVNPTDRPIPLEWEVGPGEAVVWRTQDDTMPAIAERHPIIEPRGWLLGLRNQQLH